MCGIMPFPNTKLDMFIIQNGSLLNNIPTLMQGRSAKKEHVFWEVKYDHVQIVKEKRLRNV